jgi:hypothetical protein
MTFRGSVGEGTDNTTLPVENVKAGDTYIVVGSTVVDGGNGNLGLQGDLFIASGTENDNGYLTDINWVHVPAGDEIDTTYTFTFVANQGLVIHDNASTKDSTLTFVGDEKAIDVTTDKELKVTHKDIARNDTKNDNESLGGDSHFTVVTGVSSNDQGHITGITTQEFILPPEDVYVLAKDETVKDTVHLKDKNGTPVGTITIGAGEKLVVSSTDNNKGAEFTIGHNTATVSTDDSNKVQLNALNDNGNTTFTVITGIEDDGYGHISGITTTEYTMPYDSTYQFSGAVKAADNSVTITNNLTDRSGTSAGSSSFALTSETLTINAAENIITAELQWGSFDPVN